MLHLYVARRYPCTAEGVPTGFGEAIGMYTTHDLVVNQLLIWSNAIYRGEWKDATYISWHDEDETSETSFMYKKGDKYYTISVELEIAKESDDELDRK